MSAAFTSSYRDTAGRYQALAAACLETALTQHDPTEKAALLRRARLWAALSALAKKLWKSSLTEPRVRRHP
jgi:hypothetical protein